jgi:hypothetical protein
MTFARAAVSKARGRLLLILLLEFSGDESKGNEDQTALSPGWANNYATVPVPGAKPFSLSYLLQRWAVDHR